ncbi:MAG: primosomal protein N' [Candidatus Nomurabacteria bacterium]|jgi:primosomal protein N' (replication factor Y)|nr:primosomal protein N' [Candidatus Nomurabacteria bacterium]
MKFYEVSPYGVVGKDFRVLTYAFDGSLSVGAVVEIPVGRRKFVGVALRAVAQPEFECKQILRVLVERPLPAPLLALHAWLGEFYSTHPSTVWQTMLPAGLNKNRRAVKKSLFSPLNTPERTNYLFTPEQSEAIQKILKMSRGTAILHGRTGSGKTEVYKALAMEAATRGKSSIVLVPEISLTAQLVGEFQRDFANVIVAHSGQTEAERARGWLSALHADEPTVVIGARSALFMPLPDIGLIVVDECHEPSYKQEKAPRYNALRAASVLANKSGARLVLGSATPSIADYFTAVKLDRPIVKMTKLARPGAIKPKTTVVDLTKRAARSKNPIFSRPLLDAMTKTLDAKKQILLFHNRRGTAPVTLCENCGHTLMCPRCFVPLTLHADQHALTCHICAHRQPPPTSCPSCGDANIAHRGIGTKRIEDEVRRLFPEARVRRFDGDNRKGEGVHDLFDELRGGEVDIIIGTQTIAKGLDLPNLALVGIVQADAGLMLPDFSASERTFQLIAQACGRVGRGKNPTEVIVQTFQPDHPAVVHGAAQNYAAFYEFELANRARGHFPPFTHLLKLTNSYKTEKAAITAAQKLCGVIASDITPVVTSDTSVIASAAKQSSAAKDTPSSPGLLRRPSAPRNDAVDNVIASEAKQSTPPKILGPTPAFYERQRDNYRWQIVVRAENRADLQQIAAQIPPAKWQIELDPNSLI